MGMATMRFRFRLKDIRARTKISLIFVFLLVPIAYATWTVYAEKHALIATSERELTGSAYIVAVRPALFAVVSSTRPDEIHTAVETARAAQKKLGESRELLPLADEYAF